MPSSYTAFIGLASLSQSGCSSEISTSLPMSSPFFLRLYMAIITSRVNMRQTAIQSVLRNGLQRAIASNKNGTTTPIYSP